MKKISILALISLIVIMNSYSQKSTDTPNRKPVVAGKFYPARKQALEQNLADLFAAAPGKQTENTLAVIAPHAGYVFSGEVAAASFNQIDADKEYDNIFILASSHRATYKGGSIYNQGNYETPLGEVKVNIPLADKLISENGLFDYHPSAHSGEHSLEVQLPFLQYKLKNDF
ncbi:MAG: AmmeMemoRadiSam system protein B, partial [Bacteroidales bacterium]|nr:AmmeMemoRadiSam system protein B [Bacteroidales bacterium]